MAFFLDWDRVLVCTIHNTIVFFAAGIIILSQWTNERKFEKRALLNIYYYKIPTKNPINCLLIGNCWTMKQIHLKMKHVSTISFHYDTKTQKWKLFKHSKRRRLYFNNTIKMTCRLMGLYIRYFKTTNPKSPLKKFWHTAKVHFFTLIKVQSFFFPNWDVKYL